MYKNDIAALTPTRFDTRWVESNSRPLNALCRCVVVHAIPLSRRMPRSFVGNAAYGGPAEKLGIREARFEQPPSAFPCDRAGPLPPPRLGGMKPHANARRASDRAECLFPNLSRAPSWTSVPSRSLSGRSAAAAASAVHRSGGALAKPAAADSVHPAFAPQNSSVEQLGRRITSPRVGIGSGCHTFEQTEQLTHCR